MRELLQSSAPGVGAPFLLVGRPTNIPLNTIVCECGVQETHPGSFSTTRELGLFFAVPAIRPYPVRETKKKTSASPYSLLWGRGSALVEG